MKKVLYTLLIVFLCTFGPFAIGFFLPGIETTSKITVIDQPYFQVLADITNHFEAKLWRTDLDTIYQTNDIDGYETWVEKYTSGDSVFLKINKVTEFDLICLEVDNFNHELSRNVTLKDINGKTAVKISKETYIGGPFRRFFALFTGSDQFVKTYINDLTTKYKNAPPADMGF